MPVSVRVPLPAFDSVPVEPVENVPLNVDVSPPAFTIRPPALGGFILIAPLPLKAPIVSPKAPVSKVPLALIVTLDESAI